MKKVLYMHGGSGNHGCEAIVRTTSALLDGPENVVLWSLSREEDEKYKVSECVEKIIQSEEIRRYSASYFEALFRRKIRREAEANLHVFLRDQFKDAAAFSIGGDNYCYPWSAQQNVQLNREIRKYSKKTISVFDEIYSSGAGARMRFHQRTQDFPFSLSYLSFCSFLSGFRIRRSSVRIIHAVLRGDCTC